MGVTSGADGDAGHGLETVFRCGKCRGTCVIKSEELRRKESVKKGA